MMDGRFARQSFLGSGSEQTFERLTIGIVGLGGGGSHVLQQVAHIGVGHVIVADPDYVTDTNINRLVGATWQDVIDRTPKVVVAERVIKGINIRAKVRPIGCRWQGDLDTLRAANILIGCVDSYSGRDELERLARRLIVPYIDIGMDVHTVEGGHVIGGQVLLSMPGKLCMWCMGFLTEERLAQEARHYGNVGGRPQVVWPNGVLASTAVALLVQLATPWYPSPIASAYLEYDGNSHTIHSSNRLAALTGAACTHYPPDAVGDPLFSDKET
jgi:molybdopterin-synthase adenylyltransferase